MGAAMDLYRGKRISADEAAAMVRSHSTVDYYAFSVSSRYLDAALAKRAGELEDVTIRSEIRIAPPFQTFMADPEGKTFRLETLFMGPIELMVPADRRAYTPARLSEFERLFVSGDLTTDIAAFMVSPPDNDGYLYFCPSPSLALVDARHAKCFMAEINENLFPIAGSEERRIHISEVDYVIEGDNPPLMPLPRVQPTPITEAIARHIVGELFDGACLQIGFGDIPDAVAELIIHSDLKDLGIHTELMGDGIMNLYKAGKITGAKKQLQPGKITAGIAFGSQDFYTFMRECPDLYMTVSSYTNNPTVIAQNDHVVGINAFLDISLAGDVNAESVGGQTFSGTGGHLDFAIGAQGSKNGKSILCGPSTYVQKDGTRVSRIVAALPPNATVTTPRSCMHYVCTEYGIVNLRGRTLPERAELLIGIAHPDFREALIRDAEQMGLWRPRNRR
ncbi:MAG TPA: acetyl-CoA hydrolase/transferase C-terminal domain-containing protein [Candidatus Hydrogenedentes bacterium]|nr:acetyl-CoA hydrolase/transferase C-terminal domain-containing protein [Candidatus Hydrogenedentota bacterium]HPC17887.1 acetyl-CoA hydrolase/transferase C-terminal domain-containing protein [Candidatus Hydrogenedentota bacterium]HRT21254.1 acetyl-CoA hydrolase/transferase C-terminal domain-containing protein [Candidatus Hydrogenedentota bacterium]HRT65116.1 acetyl-CoA hydrolase/transferase C-terminal domain-containing protein [Candidatus Hydrogenedentota bacterium]